MCLYMSKWSHIVILHRADNLWMQQCTLQLANNRAACPDRRFQLHTREDILIYSNSRKNRNTFNICSTKQTFGMTREALTDSILRGFQICHLVIWKNLISLMCELKKILQRISGGTPRSLEMILINLRIFDHFKSSTVIKTERWMNKTALTTRRLFEGI